MVGLHLRLSGLFNTGNLPVPETDLVLRYPSYADFDEWSSIREESREFLERWEPQWPHDDLTRFGFRRRLRSYARQRTEGTGKTYFLFNKEKNTLLGGLALTRISYQNSRSAMLGYWMASRHAGKGYMQKAVTAIMQHAFFDMQLERLEAACIPCNRRSIHILEKCGFKREGLAKGYLEINGQREDHVLFGIVRPAFERASKF